MELARPSRWLKVSLLALILAAGAALFLNRAFLHARTVNTDITRGDQSAYINYGEALAESHGAFVGSRNRMPAIPILLSFIWDSQQSDGANFGPAKGLNIFVSLLSLGLVGSVLFRFFPVHAAMNLLLITAFTFFLFKAAYVQAEVLYYTLFFLGFVVLWRVVVRPNGLLALAGGALFALAFLTKASVLPALAAFVAIAFCDSAWRGLHTHRWKTPLRLTACAGLVLAAFVLVLYPYISKSKQVYGHYFYNVNSTFYFWCDSWDQAKVIRDHGDRNGWPTLPADQLPGPSKYLREHTWSQILHRITYGAGRVNATISESYGYYPFLIAYAVLAGLLIIWKRRLAWRALRRRPFIVLGLLGLFAGYFLLSAWYIQIVRGERFILGLLLPCLFTLYAVSSFLGRRVSFRIGRWTVPFLPAVNFAFSIWIAVVIAYVCSYSILKTYGGS